jgi:hypothetical protein
MSQIVTITVSHHVPHTDRFIEKQTAFRIEQLHDPKGSLADREIKRLSESVRNQVDAETGPGVLCTDGLYRVSKK